MDKVYDFRFKPNENHYSVKSELDEASSNYLLAIYLMRGNEGLIEHLKKLNITEVLAEYLTEVIIYMSDIKPFQLLFVENFKSFSLN